MKKSLLLSLALILVVFFTRFAWLTQYPPHLTQDEVAVGYNAYSILKTGRDEWGEKLPLQFRSVGDYKQPILIYSTVPFIALLGPTELAVRLPSAIFSALTVLVFFFLTRDYLFSSRHRRLAWLAAFLLAISPWHIFYSRSGHDGYIGLFFSLLHLYFLFRFRSAPKPVTLWGIILSGFLAIASYHSTKLFIPLLDLIFIFLLRRQILEFIRRTNKLKLTVSIILIALLAAFTLSTFVFGISATRAKMTFLIQDFDYARVLLPQLPHFGPETLRRLGLLLSFWFKRHLEYFLPSFYLFDGLGIIMARQPGLGVIYPIEFLFFVIGFFALFRTKVFRDNRFTAIVLLAWFLLSFLPASLANNSKHAMRSLPAVIPLIIFITIGLHKLPKRPILVALIVLAYLWGIIRFADYYLVHYPVQLSEHRQYPWKQAAQFAIQNADKYDQVVIDPRFGTEGPYTVGVPHYYFLFYSRFNPAVYNTDPRRSQNSSDFANFTFRHVNWQVEDHQGKLYVGSPWSLPLKDIPDSQVKFRANFQNRVLGLIVVDGNY